MSKNKLLNVKEIASGDSHSVALLNNGDIYSCGRNIMNN